MREPYTKRRELLENLELAGPHWSFTPSFSDGEALCGRSSRNKSSRAFAKPLGSFYKPGERRWLKVKNTVYWKYAIERETVAERRTKSGRRLVGAPLTV